MKHNCPICQHACNQDPVVPSKLRGQRTSRGLKAAQRAGFHIGRPLSFDYEKALAMRKAGKSFRKIAVELGVSHPAVYRAVKGLITK